MKKIDYTGLLNQKKKNFTIKGAFSNKKEAKLCFSQLSPNT
ncbi:MAG TPA: hypothetical protein PLG87_06965 [Treponemataceae bacterium]|jgi:hypothetical protein|nr:hypothetical protein [Treponemataceae bacterium]